MPSSRALLDRNVSLADVAIERWLPLHVVWIGPCFSPSTGFRSQNINITSGYDVIWARLWFWCLDVGLGTAFIELCAAAATLALIVVIATLISFRWDNLVWLPNCCSPLHWSQILDKIRLEGPKKYWRSCCMQNGFVVARSCDHHPSVSRGMIASRTLGREKWDFPCFPNFI